MTHSRGPGPMPVGHGISRLLLGSLVASLIVAAIVLAVLHAGSELAVGRVVWGSVKSWALPW